jgi:hypothetical protein
MHAFHINALSWFLTYSACFEPHGFIIGRQYVHAGFVWNTLFHLLDCLHKCMKSIQYQYLYLLTYILIYLLTYLFTYLHAYLLTYLLTYILTYLLTHSLTPWSRVLLEKLTGCS